VICEGSSTTQVRAIAQGIEEKTQKKLREKPWHVEGTLHQEWILLDYVNIVAHVFLPEVRNFYRLEDLWSDGIIQEHKD